MRGCEVEQQAPTTHGSPACLSSRSFSPDWRYARYPASASALPVPTLPPFPSGQQSIFRTSLLAASSSL